MLSKVSEKLAEVPRQYKRLMFCLTVVFLALIPGEFGGIIRSSISDAYLSVSVFVALTLILIFSLERLFNFDIGEYNATHPNMQVGVSALLGALPGCGGAIIVLTQYVQRKVSFGAVIATLTATMGDAAFLLLATQPKVALAIIGMSLVVGAITGWIVDRIHGRDFLMVEEGYATESYAYKHSNMKHIVSRRVEPIWWVILIPGSIFSIAAAFQIDTDTWFPSISFSVTEMIGVTGTLLSLLLWVFDSYDMGMSHASVTVDGSFKERVQTDTNFISAWVVGAFLFYEILIYVFDLDLKQAFSSVLWSLPMVGILVGFIPGCGPQILVTTLYINGIIPLSAQIGNALSNDGDALFPAIAVAPKAAILATLYSAIPAVIVAYTYFFFFE